MDLGVAYLLVGKMRDEAVAGRVELVSGRKESEVWKEVSGESLPSMFQTYRKLLATELTTRFQLDTTPNTHVLLALKMNPSVNTNADSPQLKGKAAKAELMEAEYKRALRRQAMHKQQRTALANAPAPVAVDAAAAAAVADAPAVTTAAAVRDTAMPAPKRRKSLLSAVMAQQVVQQVVLDDSSAIDNAVKSEIANFGIISARILAEGSNAKYFQKGSLFNLHSFWADHKLSLPFHYGVYLAEVGCKKAAAANVESVFSGAGKFTQEAKTAQPVLLQRMIKLHYNWKYAFLRPTIEQVCKRYKAKFGTAAPGTAATPDAAAAAAPAAATAATAPAAPAAAAAAAAAPAAAATPAP